MGSGSSSHQSSRPPDVGFLNPGAATLNALFGIPIAIREGQFQLLPPSAGGDVSTAPPPTDLFTEGTPLLSPEDFADIPDLLDIPNPFLSAIGPLGLEAAGAGFGAAATAGTILDTLGEGLRTGFPINFDPIRERAFSNFDQFTAPQEAQSAIRLGKGATDTDFINNFLSARGNLERDLAALESQFSEGASQRRAQLLPFAAQTAGAAAGVPIDASAGLLNLGEQLISVGTPAGRQADFLNQILSGQPTGAIPRGNISGGRSSSVGVLK